MRTIGPAPGMSSSRQYDPPFAVAVLTIVADEKASSLDTKVPTSASGSDVGGGLFGSDGCVGAVTTAATSGGWQSEQNMLRAVIGSPDFEIDALATVGFLGRRVFCAAS